MSPLYHSWCKRVIQKELSVLLHSTTLQQGERGSKSGDLNVLFKVLYALGRGIDKSTSAL